MNDTQKLAADIARLRELDSKRTPGSWFFSARTLRSEILSRDEDGDEFVDEAPDILNVDSDKCIYARREVDARFIEEMANTAPEAINSLVELVGEMAGALDSAVPWLELVEKSLMGKSPEAFAKAKVALASAAPVLEALRGRNE